MFGATCDLTKCSNVKYLLQNELEPGRDCTWAASLHLCVEERRGDGAREETGAHSEGKENGFGLERSSELFILWKASHLICVVFSTSPDI
ncbi:hypothetical protein CBR_g12279 [Chara braunii]|uniref:Uncharacterized protein n=1 Tax=Chara braunii TaxID=69332 RepID=A0A388KRL9_CHABU|nr:hypothetical protein CBR_g12279 [Chara braunii]|eukprot:GBG72711.1 hypothetical protein CBR_g12279 [Chara braunii]